MTSNNYPLVTVLTPVYNGEAFLRDCIESILAQTYQNWEYLIVNNCSTDNTLEIAQEYAAKDSRIHVHDNAEFLSALSNHNHALRLISPEGKYCKIVHADDWLFPECLSRMVALAEENPSVGIVGSYMLRADRVVLDGLPYGRSVIPGSDICRQILLRGPIFFGTPTTVLIRSDLIRMRKEFFNEANIYADHEACYEVLRYSDFGFIHQVLSCTRVHSEQRTSYANRFNTFIAAKLNMTVKYGSSFLSESERKRRLSELEKEYYRYLGQNLFLLRGKDFWRYHKKELRKAGFPLKRSRLARAAFCEFAELAFNPKRTTERIFSKWRLAVQFIGK